MNVKFSLDDKLLTLTYLYIESLTSLKFFLFVLWSVKLSYGKAVTLLNPYSLTSGSLSTSARGSFSERFELSIEFCAIFH